MTTIRKDIGATVLTALAVLAFLAAHEGWNVWLVGGSNRWAAAAVLLLGLGACSLASPDGSGATWLFGALGVAALALGVVALATGSLTALSLLVAVTVTLWAAATVRHHRRNATGRHPLSSH